ncbi:hypothetical protein HMPREF9440_00316 [Sutterella parvirubra YIT 11816]|uniref:Uncharacterized protein n=1 Tax=Sutterella parvirubra YIT 11816 TaxID=762967 RepID=H3KC66_9BURK|nr:hypothetical protein HMPREF9440_00316 [Sutterella parvirubra YIT 11816]
MMKGGERSMNTGCGPARIAARPKRLRGARWGSPKSLLGFRRDRS